MYSKHKNILVCGATGFIGRNTSMFLSKNNDYNVFGTYNKTEPFDDDNICFVKADLTDKDDVDSVISGMDVVIHVSAVTSGANDIINKPYIHVTDNAIMTSLILRSAFEHKVKHVIYPSCSIVYNSSDKPLKESDCNLNNGIISKYYGVGWTKIYIEKMCKFFSNISDTKFTVLRHSNIYGLFDKFDLEHSHVFGATLAKVLNAKDRVVVWGDGSEKRDLLYVSDLVDFFDMVIKKQKNKFELFNVGSGSLVSVDDLVKKIIGVSNKKIDIVYDVSMPFIKSNICLDISKANDVLGWYPKVSLDDGIRKTIDWYKTNIN